eukprot:TRINITY_DN20226_c0_g2_i1.p1 TRINITY_DN20226_c0_g2~~TRINITY_DN20226_c0_g2_i1.p1  ORF type:complete len:447 (-),score=65.87 TRINITY_DN20226_c0_g2_i1:51-1391(-)
MAFATKALMFVLAVSSLSLANINASCEDEADSSLLQTRSSQDQAAIKSKKQKPVGLPLGVGLMTSAGQLPHLRFIIGIKVGAKDFNVMVDSGSSTLALCDNSLENSTDTGLMACATYGNNCHGFSGPVVAAPFEFGGVKISKPMPTVLMQYKAGMQHNDCVSSTPPLDGILGVGNGGLSFQFRVTPTTGVPNIFESGTCPPGGYECPPAMFGGLGSFETVWWSFVESNGGRNRRFPYQFGIYWDGAGFGPGSGSIFTGDAVDTFRETSKMAKPIVTGMHLYQVDRQSPTWSMSYYINVTSYVATAANGTTLQTIAHPMYDCYVGRVGPCVASAYVDTGNPGIFMPDEIINAMEVYFSSTSADEATVSIGLGDGQALDLLITRDWWIWASPCMVSGGVLYGALGSPLWYFYKFITFDVARKQFTFVKRETPLVISDAIKQSGCRPGP